jgi:SPP1 gp7 family putative phage head morphogenesis protein
MAIRRQTLRLSNELRIVVQEIADAATRTLVEAWVRAWTQIEREWADAIEDLVSTGDGNWPTRAQIDRASRAQRALRIATREVMGLAEMSGVTVMAAAEEAVGVAAEWQARLIASQMPRRAGNTAELAVRFDRVSQDALGAIVERTTEKITAFTKPLPQVATEEMKRALVRGVAVGHNPRLAARQMLARAEGAFNGGLTRALTIARTEILDAHRSGAAAAQWANEDVLAGWVWTAQLDKRTCPSCWAQHGNLHQLDETGPNDHQQGRCARVPKAKSWRELGFDVDEPADLIPDARQVFDALPEADQLAVMGTVRAQALRSGSMSWEDLTMRRTTSGWRDSYVPTPVKLARRRLLRPVR